MFKIADGRETFYQWDLDRQIIVDDPSIKEVHFCNRTDECSLVVEVEDLEIFADFKPISVLRTANVPNVLLQSSFDIRVFGYDGKATLHDEKFKVKARTKPSDYVYTEVEISRYEDLSKRVDKIEEEGVSQEAVDNAVNRYLEENPIGDVPTKVSELENDAGYATETYVDNAISNIPKVDLSKHALKSEVPTKVSQLQNDSKFITREEVPETDLSEYAKKSEIPNVSDFITSIPSEYITESELKAKGYSTFSGRYSDLIGKPDIPSTDGLAPVTYVDSKFNSIDLAPYAIKAEVAQTYAKKSEIPKDYLKEVPAEYVTESELTAKKYATQNYVDDAIAGIEIPEAESQKVYNVILPRNNGAIVTDTDTIEFLDKCLADEHPIAFEGDFIITRVQKGDVLNSEKIILSYATNAILGTASEIYYDYHFIKKDGSWTLNYYQETSRSYSADYATKNYVDNAIANIEIPEQSTEVYNLVIGDEEYGPVTDPKTAEYLNKIAAGESALATYGDYAINRARKLESTGSIFVDYSHIETNLAYVMSYRISFDVSETYPSGWQYNKPKLSTLPIPNKTSQLTNDSDFTTKTYVDEAIANIDIPEGGDTDLSNYYTKAETYSKTETYNKTEVDAAIAAVGTGGGGGSGSGKIQINLDRSNISDEVKALLTEAHTYGQTGNVLDKYDILLIDGQVRARATSISANSSWLHMQFYIYSDSTQVVSWAPKSGRLNFYSTYTVLTSNNYSDFIGGGSDWTYTTNTSDSGLYDAKEVYIYAVHNDTNQCVWSYWCGPNGDNLGNHTYQYIYFTDPDDGSWMYDGNSITDLSGWINLGCIFYR